MRVNSCIGFVCLAGALMVMLGIDVRATRGEQKRAVPHQSLNSEKVLPAGEQNRLYAEFRRNVPEANQKHIEEMLNAPFEKREILSLMKQLKVKSRAELEKEITRLGSSMADFRTAFNERVIAREWMRWRIKNQEKVRH